MTPLTTRLKTEVISFSQGQMGPMFVLQRAGTAAGVVQLLSLSQQRVSSSTPVALTRFLHQGSMACVTLAPGGMACWQVEWAHLDIAGPCWDDKAGGATGFGALTLAEWAIAQGGPQ